MSRVVSVTEHVWCFVEGCRHEFPACDALRTVAVRYANGDVVTMPAEEWHR